MLKFIKNLFAFHFQFSAVRKGMAALPMIVMLGGLTAEIVIFVTATSYIFITSEFGTRLSAGALMAAKTGIQDATLKIIRDKNFTSATTTLATANYFVDVSVCKDLPCIANGKHKILAVGKAQTRRRALQAILNIDSATGKVQLESLTEIKL